MIAYGVASRTMLNPDELSFDGRSIFQNIIYPVYYFLYGNIDNELNLVDGK